MTNNKQYIQYIGFWPRFIAFIIDSLFVGVLGYFFIDTNNLIDGSESLQNFMNYLVSFVFITLFWIYKSATPGKMVIGAILVDATTLLPLTKFQCIIRYVGYIVAAIPFGLGFLWIAFDSKKQGFHDKIANTIVISKD